MRRFSFWMTILAVAGICLAACNGESTAYTEACTADTPEAYQGYIDQYPDGLHIADVRHRLDLADYEIAEKDVREAARILAAWRETHNPSAGLTRATAELDLHLGRYEQALAGFETSLPALDSAIDDPRELLAARIAVYRRIAICHDLLGDRDQALRAYEAAVDVFEAQGYEGDRRAFWFSWFGIDAMPEPPFTWTRSPAIVVLPGGAESSPDTGDGAAGTTPRPAGRWAEAVVDQNV